MSFSVNTKKLIGMYRYDATKKITQPIYELDTNLLNVSTDPAVVNIDKSITLTKISGSGIIALSNLRNGFGSVSNTTIAGRTGLGLYGQNLLSLGGEDCAIYDCSDSSIIGSNSSYLTNTGSALIVGGANSYIEGGYRQIILGSSSSYMQNGYVGLVANSVNASIKNATFSTVSGTQSVTTTGQLYQSNIFGSSNIKTNDAFKLSINASDSVTLFGANDTSVVGSTSINNTWKTVDGYDANSSIFKSFLAGVNDAVLGINQSYTTILSSINVNFSKSALPNTSYNASSNVIIAATQSVDLKGSISQTSILGSYNISMDGGSIDILVSNSSSSSIISSSYSTIVGSNGVVLANAMNSSVFGSYGIRLGDSTKTSNDVSYITVFNVDNGEVKNSRNMFIVGGNSNANNVTYTRLTYSYGATINNTSNSDISFSSGSQIDWVSTTQVMNSSGSRISNVVDSSIVNSYARVGIGFADYPVASSTKKVKNVDLNSCSAVDVVASYVTAKTPSVGRTLNTIGEIVEGPAAMPSPAANSAMSTGTPLSANRSKFIMTAFTSGFDSALFSTTNKDRLHANEVGYAGNGFLTIPKNTIWVIDLTMIGSSGENFYTDDNGSKILNAVHLSGQIVITRDGADEVNIYQDVGSSRLWAYAAIDGLSESLVYEFVTSHVGNGVLDFSIKYPRNESDICFSKVFNTLSLDIKENSFDYSGYGFSGSNEHSVAT